MLKIRYKSLMLLSFLIGLVACSTEQFNDELTSGDTPIELSGALTRAAGDGLLITTGNPLIDYKNANINFFLSSRIAANNNPYFSNISMSVGNSLSDGRNELNSSVYYPLGKTPINLYAHTGVAATGSPANMIPLTSGTADRKSVV